MELQLNTLDLLTRDPTQQRLVIIICERLLKVPYVFLTVSLQKYQYWAVLPSIVAVHKLSYLKSSKQNKKIVKLLQNILIAIEFTQTIWVLPKAESSQEDFKKDWKEIVRKPLLVFWLIFEELIVSAILAE